MTLAWKRSSLRRPYLHNLHNGHADDDDDEDEDDASETVACES